MNFGVFQKLKYKTAQFLVSDKWFNSWEIPWASCSLCRWQTFSAN